MSGIENKDVSDPLKHLFSLNFGRNSPVLDKAALNIENEGTETVHDVERKVRFTEPQVQEDTYRSKNSSNSVTELKSILKTKLTIEDNALLSSHSEEHSIENYNDDFSTNANMLEENSNLNDLQHEELNSNSADYILLGSSTIFLAIDEPNSGEFNENLADTNIVNIFPFNTVKDNNSAVPTSLKIDADNPVFVLPIDIDEQIQIHASDVKQISHSIESKHTRELSSIMKVDNICPVNDTNEDSCDLSSLKIDSERPALVLSEESSSFIKPEIDCSSSCLLATVNETRVESQVQGSVLNPPTQQKTDKKSKQSQSMGSASVGVTCEQTARLKSILKDELLEIHSAKDLKLSVFNAWRKVKEERANASRLSMENKSSLQLEAQKTNVSSEAFLRWIKSKDDLKKLKKKAKREALAQSGEIADNKKENDLAYHAWKLRKEDEKKEAAHRLYQEKKERLEVLKTKEIQDKEGAHSAFKAWLHNKLEAEEKDKEMQIVGQVRERLKKKEDMERDMQAEEAYLLWLQQKEFEESQPSPPRFTQQQPWYPPG